MVIVSIPQKNIEDPPIDLFATSPKEPIIVHTGNYYPGSVGRIEDLSVLNRSNMFSYLK